MMGNRDNSYQGRGKSRARGSSRGRSGQTPKYSDSSYYNYDKKNSKGSLDSVSYRGTYKPGSRRDGIRKEKSGITWVIGAAFAMLVAVVGLVFLFRYGNSDDLDKGETDKVSVEEEKGLEKATEESVVFNPDIIMTDLYLDYSAYVKGAPLLSMKGMDRAHLFEALKQSYNWGLSVRNTNPNIDSFSMPELPSEVMENNPETAGGVDNEGTEEVVKVDTPYSGIVIRPQKELFYVPDLLEQSLLSYVEQIFQSYAENGEERFRKELLESHNTMTGDKANEISETQGVSSAEDVSADYVLEFPNLNETVVNYMLQLSQVWKMQPINGELKSYDKEEGRFVFGGTVDGYTLDPEKTAIKLLDCINSGEYSAAVDAEGEVIAASTTSIRDRYATIASYSTETSANSVRNTNIRLAASAINGTVVRPGEEFSFNDTVGQRTEEKGYGGAPAYNQGEVVEEVGGGVCQVSTTLYNAVFRSGLTSTYRRAHTFAPTYVTPGMDATVSWPGPDYRFVNNSDHSIGILAEYADQTISVQIYGIRILPEGVSWSLVSEKVKDLEMDPPQYITPEQGEESKGTTGSEWQAYKIITKDGEEQEKVKDHFVTYKGHPPKRYLVTSSNFGETAASVSSTTATPESEEIKIENTEQTEPSRERNTEEEERTRDEDEREREENSKKNTEGEEVKNNTEGESREETTKETNKETTKETETREEVSSNRGPGEERTSGENSGPGVDNSVSQGTSGNEENPPGGVPANGNDIIQAEGPGGSGGMEELPPETPGGAGEVLDVGPGG